MIEASSVFKLFRDNQIDFYAGIPDSLLKDFCAFINDNVSSDQHIITANEGSAIALASGYNIATNKIPVVYMQNSGIGNAVNPLLSLADEKVYRIPMILMIGWRGEPGVKDEPQHIKQGEVTLSLLDTLGITYVILESEWDAAEKQIIAVIKSAKNESSITAIVIRKGTFSKYKSGTEKKELFPLTREEALEYVLNQLSENDIIVSTTGKLSRELFEFRAKRMQGHGKDFLTVGSMGHSSSIALGIALQKKNRTIYCFDGDGALIMHTGAIGTIGSVSPPNFYHIVFNNGAHESVGGQPTVGYFIDIRALAKAAGYKNAYSAINVDGIKQSIDLMRAQSGPCLLEIKINCRSREDLGRPTTTPLENKLEFMQNLNK